MMDSRKRQLVSRVAPVNELTRHQRQQLSVATLGVDERTIRRAYANPAGVRESTLLRIAAAARSLGLPEPVQPTRGTARDGGRDVR